MNANSFNTEPFNGMGFATIEQARCYFRVSRSTLMRWATQANAIVAVGRLKRINVGRIQTALEHGELK